MIFPNNVVKALRTCADNSKSCADCPLHEMEECQTELMIAAAGLLTAYGINDISE